MFSRLTTIRIAAFATAGVLILGGFCLQGWLKSENYRRQIEYGYQRSFDGLVEGIGGAQTALRKTMYASGTSMTVALATEISRQAAAAQSDLGALPFSYAELENTSRFLSKLADWSNSLAHSSAGGAALTDEQREQLLLLCGAAERVSAGLTALRTIAEEEHRDIGKLLAASPDGSAFRSLGDNIKDLETEFSGLPTLIYDGPFSDHIEQRGALFLENEPELDRAAATARAADYLGIAPELLQPLGEGAGNLPTYQFLARLDGGEYNVSVSKRGGYAADILSSRPIGEPKLTLDEACAKAAEYLQSMGFLNMRQRYFTRVGNMLLINFAATQDGVTCYPDLIKVGIALDNGRIHQLEAVGYLMNHTQRDLPPNAISMEQAKSGLAAGLFVVSGEVCIIPTAGLNEVCCYGFNCLDADGRSLLIYVNAQTGAEERILILLEDENGTLTI
ncbi:germination protein YpeB [Clostridia bacterium]|nr:germination protein YpeB [Clostridia bacterium]